MEVFKICKAEHANSLSASGVPNRWNKKDEFVIYTGSSRALSTLEMIAHKSGINLSNPYKLLTIEILDETLIAARDIQDLPAGWKTLSAYVELQEIGSEWYHSLESLVLKVPSSIIQQESNYIINTKHPDFLKNVSLRNVEDFIWDKRLM